jgi:outer membrane protein OmpA-like peptidoglycan-associated protein
MKKKLIFIIFSMVVFINCIHAGDELVGTTSTNFLKIAPFARAEGMGEAYTAISDGTYGLYYNPAGLCSLIGYEVQASHIAWFQDINYEFASFVGSIPHAEDLGKIGIAIAWLQVSNMARTAIAPSYDPSYLNSIDPNSLINGNFSPYDYSVIIGYGQDINENFSAGLTLKINSENIDNFSGSNFVGDLGAMYKIVLNNNLIRAGLTISNIGASLRMNNAAFGTPLNLQIGLADQVNLYGNELTLSGQVIPQTDYDPLCGVGAEYWINNILALRLGYEFGAFNQPTFGVGIKYADIEFDYAYVSYDELGNTNRVSLVYAWGSPPLKLKVSPLVFSPNGDKYMDWTYFFPIAKLPDKIRSLKIDIYDETGQTLLTSIGAKSGLDKYVAWDGKVNGVVLKDGVYTAKATAEYDSGKSESNQTTVEIDNTPPEVRVDAEPKLLRVGQENLMIPATFTFYAHDKNNIGAWQFAIWDKDKKVFFSTKGKGDPPLSYIWDGKGDNGDYVSTGNIYYYSLIAYDTVGNKAQTPVQSQVVLLKEIKLTFSSDTLFDLGKADVKISAYNVLKTMKDTLDKYPESDIVVAGYTDNTPINAGKYGSNTELSKARADAVKFFMVNLLDMDEKRISTEGYGEKQPIASNDTDEGRQKNRRVEIIIKSTIYK